MAGRACRGVAGAAVNRSGGRSGSPGHGARPGCGGGRGGGCEIELRGCCWDGPAQADPWWCTEWWCEMPARAKRGGQKAPAPGPAKKSKGAARTFGGSTVMVCIGGVIENHKCHGFTFIVGDAAESVETLDVGAR